MMRRGIKMMRIFFVIIGPGLIVTVADNDAGGITTYAATGVKYGYSFILPILFIIPLVYVVQELTLRVGILTKRGFAEAVFEGFGARWGWFALFNMLLACWLTLVTEYIGVSAALGIFGIPPWASVCGVWLMLIVMVMSGRYWTWEKIGLVLCVVNFIYVPAAIMAKPDYHQIIREGLIPHIPGGRISGEMLVFLLANIGTTITTWQICFQQSAVVDKGVAERDIPWSRTETFVGSVLTCLVAVFIVILTGALMFPHHVQVDTAQGAAIWIMENHSRLIGIALAVGLMNAGLLGAICMAVTVSWSMGEVFGWAHSLNEKVREAPAFYLLYMALIISAGLMMLIARPSTLMYIVLFVQVAAVTLLPAALIFLIMIANDGAIMGKWKNTPRWNVVSWSVATIIILLSTSYGLVVLFPNLIPLK
jgi:Mn2+/Fe2+ NRAMP family transporter